MKMPSELECRRAANSLDDILPYAYDYLRRKRLEREAFQNVEEFEDTWSEINAEEDFESVLKGSLAAGTIFGRTDRTAAFLRSVKSELSDQALSLGRQWRTQPWAYAFVEFGDSPGRDLTVVHPVGERPGAWSSEAQWNDLLVFSRSIARYVREGYKMALVQLCPAGSFFLVHGAPIPFRGYSHEDVYFIADVAAHDDASMHDVPLVGINGRTRTVSDTIARSPVLFFALVQTSEVPAVTNRMGVMGRFASHAKVSPGSDAEPNAGTAASEVTSCDAWHAAARRVGEQIAECEFTEFAGVVRLGDGSPMYDPTIYISLTGQRVFLSAMHREAYDRGRKVAAGIVTMPEEPESRANMGAFYGAREVFGMLDELAGLADFFGDEDIDVGEEGNDEVDPRLPRIMERIQHNYNEGISDSDERIAEDLDVDVEMVEEIRSRFEEVIEGMRGEQMEPGSDRPDTLRERYDLPPRHIHELFGTRAPVVRGAIVTRSAEELAARIGRTADDGDHKQVILTSLSEQSSAFRFAEWFLKSSAQAKGVPLTQSGYVATSVIAEAYDKRILPTPGERAGAVVSHADMNEETEAQLKPKKELDWTLFALLRRVLDSANLVRLEKRHLRATDRAVELLDNPAALYRTLLEAMFESGEWAVSHIRELDILEELVRFAPILVFMAGAESFREARGAVKAPQWIDIQTLKDAFVDGNPQMRDVRSYASPEMTDIFAELAVRLHFLMNFAEPMGLVEIRVGDDERGGMFRVTGLFLAVFDHAWAKA